MFRASLAFFLCLIFVFNLTTMPACYGVTTNHESGVNKKGNYFIVPARKSSFVILYKRKTKLNYIEPNMQFSDNELKKYPSLYDNHGIAVDETEFYSPVLYKMKVAEVGGAGIGLLLGEVIAKASGHRHSFLKSAWLGAYSAAAATAFTSFLEQQN